MSKKTKQAAKPTAFSLGDRVTVSNAATNDQPVAGTIERIDKGWLNVRTDDGQIVSARESSLKAILADIEDRGPESLTDLQPAETTTDAEVQPVEEKDEHPMARALRQARVHYIKAKRPDGSNTANCGDRIARFLQDFEPVEVAYLADKVLQTPDGFHAQKYGSLNPGQIRMNSGNRIRGAWNKARETSDEEATRVGRLLGLLDMDETASQAGLYIAPAEVEEQEERTA